MPSADDLLKMLFGMGLPRPERDNRWTQSTPQTGSEEREATHDTINTTISGLADMLEARHRASEAGEALGQEAHRRSREGFSDGDEQNIGYDYAAFGVHTIRTLLELNVRANRKLLKTLRASAQASTGSQPSGGEPREQPLAPINLTLPPKAPTPEGRYLELGSFEVTNRRGTRLALHLPDAAAFRAPGKPDTKTGELTWDTWKLPLSFIPNQADLDSGETREFKVFLAFPETEKRQKKIARRITGHLHHFPWRGVLSIKSEHGRMADWPVTLDTRELSTIDLVRLEHDEAIIAPLGDSSDKKIRPQYKGWQPAEGEAIEGDRLTFSEHFHADNALRYIHHASRVSVFFVYLGKRYYPIVSKKFDPSRFAPE